MTFKPIQASTISRVNGEKFWLQGPAGCGKSTQIITLPGRTLVWCFGTAQTAAYRGYENIDVQTYDTDVGARDFTPYSLSKNASGEKTAKVTRPEAFKEFRTDFKLAWESNGLDPYANIVFDPVTLLSEMVMDEVLHINGRYGKTPQQDDWQPQMKAIQDLFRAACSLPMNVFFILHDEYIQDGDTKKMMNVPMLTGKLKGKLPTLFNHLLHFNADQSRNSQTQKMETRYFMQTSPDRYTPSVRTSFRGLESVEDVTVEDFSKPQEYGLGKIIKHAE